MHDKAPLPLNQFDLNDINFTNISGTRGSGRSTVATEIACKIIAQCTQPLIFLSSEYEPRRVAEYMACLISNTAFKTYFSDRCSEAEFTQHYNALVSIFGNPLIKILTTRDTTKETLKQIISQYNKTNPVYKPVIVIDHLMCDNPDFDRHTNDGFANCISSTLDTYSEIYSTLPCEFLIITSEIFPDKFGNIYSEPLKAIQNRFTSRFSISPALSTKIAV